VHYRETRKSKRAESDGRTMVEFLHIDSADLPREAVIFGSCTAAMREVRTSVDPVLNSYSPVWA
jgi:hypothetical protein